MEKMNGEIFGWIKRILKIAKWIIDAIEFVLEKLKDDDDKNNKK